MKSMRIKLKERMNLNKLRKKASQCSWYNRRYSTCPRPKLEVSQPVMINEPSGNQVPAMVIETRGREIVARSQTNKLFRQNKNHVRGRDGESTRKEEQIPPGQHAP